ncbi:MAG: ribosome biogenesis GTPase Der [Lachnospiraceae bacterium]|nr:ribosome biogenesis GTPase Der [Lachnospiraceae bacterium]
MSKPIVAIVGRPNVGKSTLFNALAGEKISIVEDIPGVTRDRIYADITWLNHSFTMIDTGGIEPESKDVILSQMREQAQMAIDSADVIIFLTDVRQGLVDADHKVADMLRRSRKPVVLVVNKVDSFEKFQNDVYEFYNLGLGDPIPVSAASLLGFGDMLDRVTELFPKQAGEEEEDTRPKIAIVGKPNVGKSSLLNALLEEDRAIVTDIAGTTRDTLTEEIRVNGISLVLVDTAGIRNTLDPVEEIGVRKAREQAQEADLILFVADASVPLDENDKEILRGNTNARVLALLNKSDLFPVTTEEDLKNLLSACGCDAEILSISAKDGAGLNELRDKISGMFFSGDILTDDEVAITAERQKECLNEAEASLSHVLEALSANMPEDFLSIDLMGAYGALSRILGEEVDEDLIDRIFETFCLGK